MTGMAPIPPQKDAIGTSPNPGDVRLESAKWAKPDIEQTPSNDRVDRRHEAGRNAAVQRAPD